MIAEKVVASISVGTIRQMLKAARVRLRRSKTWKEYNDPKLRSKKTDPPLRESTGRQRADDLVRRVRAAGDPTAAGTQLGNPARTAACDVHAQARRAALVAFYDVHADQLWGYVRKRKRAREILGALKLMRKRYPAAQRIHLILDNLSAHGTPAVRRWRRDNNIHLIWTPTNASWLNPIECQFTPVKEFVIRNSDYADHDELDNALRRYARYRKPPQRR